MMSPRDEQDRTLTAPVSRTSCPIVPGDIVGGRYTIELLIGDGTYGWVLTAIDSNASPPRRVALKFLRPEQAASPWIFRRFHDRELALLQRVEETCNVVRVLESSLGVHRSLPFIVLEFIDGPSLRDRLDSRRPFREKEIARVGLGVAHGLAALHAAGIVHRDLKPSNIRLRKGVEPVIVDLGIAAALDATPGLTATGQAPFTLRYAAPEQLAGKVVGPPCDVYALGVILEEMEAFGALEALARRCLERDPSRRPSAAEVEATIRAMLSEPPPGYAWASQRSRAIRLLAFSMTVACTRSHEPLETIDAFLWRPTAPMHWGRQEHTATRMANGEVLIVGGYDKRHRSFVEVAELFDPRHERWIVSDAIPPRKTHMSLLLPNGEVLIAGGLSLQGWLSDTRRYSPTSHTWVNAAPMGTARARSTATWLPGVNRVLVLGGRSTYGIPLATGELYDPTADHWTEAAPMSVVRSEHAAVWISGLERLLVLGGSDERGLSRASAELYDPVANAWTSAQPMAFARDRFTATQLADGRVLVTGGMSRGTALANAEIYDPAAEQWTHAPPMHVARYQHTAIVLDDGRVLVVNSYEAADAEIYDPAVNAWVFLKAPHVSPRYPAMALLSDGRVLMAGGSTSEPSACDLMDPGRRPTPLTAPGPNNPKWTLSAPMAAARSGHTMTRLPDGRVLVVGSPQGTYIDFAEIFEPRTNTWGLPIRMTAAPPGRYAATVTLLAGSDEVFVAGGGAPDGFTKSTERFDVTRSVFTSASPMSRYRHSHTATLLPSGEVLVVGGYGAGYHADAERFDPVRGVWTPATRMAAPREHHAAVSLADGRVLVAGGFDGASTLATSELYDPVTDTWAPGAPLTAPRRGGSALWVNGRVLLAGGYATGTGGIGVEIYDPRTGRWEPAAPMRVPREGYAVVALASGKLLVAGGRQGLSTFLESVEIYDPVRNTWTDAAPLRTPRFEAAAVLLADGRVLVTGGSREGRVLSSAEVYEPE